MKFFVFSLTLTFGAMIVSYEQFARAKRWPIGEWFIGDATFPKVLALVASLWALAKSFITVGWWSPFAMLPMALILGTTLTMLFRSWSQLASLVGVTICWLATIYV